MVTGRAVGGAPGRTERFPAPGSTRARGPGGGATVLVNGGARRAHHPSDRSWGGGGVGGGGGGVKNVEKMTPPFFGSKIMNLLVFFDFEPKKCFRVPTP